MNTSQENAVDSERVPNLQLRENLNGRIRNLALSPSYDNTLIPLFEAISNSIHSVQEKFSNAWMKNGKIRIQVIRDDSDNPRSFSIEDNGVGLTKENFDSFLTYDSLYKIEKGGKGVGRLTWLKVFEKVHVESFFNVGSVLHRRNFDFVLSNENPFQNYSLTKQSSNEKPRTTVYLSNLKGRYSTTCVKNTELITHRIIAHFLPFLIGDECPDIRVEDTENSYNVRDIISENTYNSETGKFSIEEVGDFEIQHLLLNKSIVEKADHKLFLSAHGRIVLSHIVNNQTGLNTYFQYEDQSVAYVGILSSDLLDNNVTQERNNFDLEKKKFEEVLKAAIDSSKLYLEEQIDDIIEAKSYTVENVLNRFPRYKYLVNDKKEFARSLPLNAKKEEDIYKTMSVYDYRESKKTIEQVEEIFSQEQDPDCLVDLEETYSKLVERISSQEQASLAEYVIKRKAIIDLLDKRLGYIDETSKQKYKEDAIHRIICPLKTDSGNIMNAQHNLWLLDDRLAFYDYWASDLSIQKFAEESDSKERPDIVLFKGSSLFHRKGTSQPHIIVEFKRPARDDYTDEENPLKQVFGYIRSLRQKKISDKDGKLVTQIKDNTPFFCYVVCDVTPRLMETLENLDMNQELPGERGYYGYNKSMNAYVEILEYEQIVKDARLRNEAFFEKLGIN